MDISAQLAEISGYGGFFAVTVGGDPSGWHPVTTSYADGFTDLIEATNARLASPEPRIGTSLVHLGHAARLWSPVLACVLAHGVLPDLTDLQRADGSAQLRLPEPVGETAPPAPELLYRVVVQDHMERVAAGLRADLAPGLRYGNIASALAGTARMLLAARPDLRGPITRMTVALLDTGELAGTGEIVGPDLGFRRNSCCLYYRVPAGGKCGDCAL
ncbi:(2Fe-2S)-binding protein [Mycobacterium vicinigordonae]|uniref:(2Fe-2S)-binding protein n=1 Tax=Mycobacterium vicinigordonae TaxID=1719132 RepID=A0A7D6IQ59_9MYCO|nr:(2Fe-2S)-binding protein [Mycobacterium vicinigordonae]QLL09340.1 (2Fe-2S)-binding protein [Mycobacterium vicinigordonae]